jgi:hypothetical protein
MSKKKIIKGIVLYLMTFIISLLISTLIIVTKFFYPYHRFIAISFYLISSIFFLFPIIKKIKNYEFKRHIPERLARIRYKKIKFVLFIIFLFGVYILFIIFPIKNISFTSEKIDDINGDLEVDFLYTKYLIINLEREIEHFVNSEYMNLTLKTASNSEINEIKNEYSLILRHIFELDELMKKYNSFYEIQTFKYPKINIESFLLAYNANIANYKAILTLSQNINGNSVLNILLNENIEPFNQTNTFFSLKSRINHPDEILKINIGRFYVYHIQKRDNLTINQEFFIDNYIDSYNYIHAFLGLGMEISRNNYIDLYEKIILNRWLPLQEIVSRKLSQTYLQRNYSYHIGSEQFEELYQILEPGDIMVHRRKWVATNIFMPGFFTHSSIYLGKSELFFEFFKNESLDLFNQTVKDYIKENFPVFYEDYTSYYENEFEYATLEGIHEMIRLLPLEKSANCDYLGVLRPKLEKSDKLLAILDAIGNYQKPYDYNFNFETDDAYVCSELIYKAYMPDKKKAGLVYDVSFVTGRYLFSPNDFVKYYVINQEKGFYQNEFVVFYDLNISNGKIFKASEESFKQAYTRPKHDW